MIYKIFIRLKNEDDLVEYIEVSNKIQCITLAKVLSANPAVDLVQVIEYEIKPVKMVYPFERWL